MLLLQKKIQWLQCPEWYSFTHVSKKLKTNIPQNQIWNINLFLYKIFGYCYIIWGLPKYSYPKRILIEHRRILLGSFNDLRGWGLINDLKLNKGQLNSAWIYEVIVSPKLQTKNYKDFCTTKQTRIVAKNTAAYAQQKITKKVLWSLFLW